jgi:hypothetical protein
LYTDPAILVYTLLPLTLLLLLLLLLLLVLLLLAFLDFLRCCFCVQLDQAHMLTTHTRRRK